MYGEDARFIATEYNKTSATLNYLNELPYQNINNTQFQKVLRDLVQNKQYRYEQLDLKRESGTHSL